MSKLGGWRQGEREPHFLVNRISVIGRYVKLFLSLFLAFLWISGPFSRYFPGWRGGVRQPGLLLGRRGLLRLWGELVRR